MMPERQYINTLIREGERFDETFLLAEKELRTAANGKMFIRGALQDRTGQARMMVWEATERFYEALPLGGFVRAKGRVQLVEAIVVSICRDVI